MKKEEILVCPKCKEEMSLAEARGTHIPTPETADKEFQVDKFGNFRIKVGETISPWTNSYDIAKIESEGKKFFAVHPSGTLAKTFKAGIIIEVPSPAEAESIVV